MTIFTPSLFFFKRVIYEKVITVYVKFDKSVNRRWKDEEKKKWRWYSNMIYEEAFKKYTAILGNRDEYTIFGGRPEWDEKGEKYHIPPNSPFKATEWVSRDQLFDKIKEMQDKGWSVWVSLNEKERGSDKIEGVKAIHTIWFDFDSPRESKARPATDEEKRVAFEQAKRFKEWMEQKYNVRGFLACSGNGYHLFFPVPRFELPGHNFRKEFNKKQGLWMKKLREESGIEFDTTTDIRRVTQPIGFPNMKIPNHPIPTFWVDDFTFQDIEEARKLNRVLINEILDTEIKQEVVVIQAKSHPKFEELLEKYEKIRDLYNGDWQKYGYPSRSEAEQAIVTFLCGHDFSDEEIHQIMMQCKIGKWQEKGDAYRKITIQKGRIYASREETKEVKLKRVREEKTKKEESNLIKISDILDYLFDEYRFITTMDTEDVYYYDGGVYKPAEPLIKKEVESILGESATRYIVEEVIGHIKRSTYIDRSEINKEKNYLPLKNGLLNLQTFELEPFTPEKIFTYKIDVEYNKEADCPMFKKFVSEVVRPEDVPILQEYAGYLLYPDMPAHKSLWLYGIGRNGKSTFVNIMKGILGSSNVVSVPLEQLDGSHRFVEAQFYGKLANIVPEPSTKKAMETVLFKKLTGGDWISAEVKFKQKRIGFYNFAKFIIFGNKYPEVRDTTFAFWERLIIIEFPYTFTRDKAKKNLAEEILNKEKSGILNWMIEGLKRLKENNFVFSESKSTERMKIEFKRLSNSVQSFIDEMIVKDVDSLITKSELYEAYKNYCENLGIEVVGKGQFTKEISKLPYAKETVQKIYGKISRCWRGIRVKTAEELEAESKLAEEQKDVESDIEKIILSLVPESPRTVSKDFIITELWKRGKVVDDSIDSILERMCFNNLIVATDPSWSNFTRPRKQEDEEAESIKILALKDIPTFVYIDRGGNLKKITIRKNDIVSLPKKFAQILIDKKVAEAID